METPVHQVSIEQIDQGLGLSSKASLASMSQWLQVCRLLRCELLGLVIVEESNTVVSVLRQFGAFAQPVRDVRQRSLDDVLLEPMAENTRNRSHDNLPSTLWWTPIQGFRPLAI